MPAPRSSVEQSILSPPSPPQLEPHVAERFLHQYDVQRRTLASGTLRSRRRGHHL